MRFRPCIDLREGRVVQIVGASLRDDAELAASPAGEQAASPAGAGFAAVSEHPGAPAAPAGRPEHVVINHISDRSATQFALQYQQDDLAGGHVIALGPGNHDAAVQALAAFAGGLQMGGGITPDNAASYLDAGASHVIVTSYIFQDGRLDLQRLRAMRATVGRERLVLDLSCRRRGSSFWIVTDRWQRFTTMQMTGDTLALLADYCAEFLVHGVDVEGQRLGIEHQLVELLGAKSPIASTYAGGAQSLDDLELVKQLGGGRVDLSIGTALDLFGGEVSYRDIVAWQRLQETLND